MNIVFILSRNSHFLQLLKPITLFSSILSNFFINFFSSMFLRISQKLKLKFFYVHEYFISQTLIVLNRHGNPSSAIPPPLISFVNNNLPYFRQHRLSTTIKIFVNIDENLKQMFSFQHPNWNLQISIAFFNAESNVIWLGKIRNLLWKPHHE